MFEIVVCVRDSQGNTTGKKKSFVTDSAYKLWEYWTKHIGNIVTHKKKTAINSLPNADEAQSILQAMFNS